MYIIIVLTSISCNLCLLTLKWHILVPDAIFQILQPRALYNLSVARRRSGVWAAQRMGWGGGVGGMSRSIKLI